MLQELWLLGRYHGQYHWSDGTSGNDEWVGKTAASEWGAQARLFNKLTLHAQMVSGSDFEPFYNGFTELWASWQFNEALNLTVGQQKHRFSFDRQRLQPLHQLHGALHAHQHVLAGLHPSSDSQR